LNGAPVGYQPRFQVYKPNMRPFRVNEEDAGVTIEGPTGNDANKIPFGTVLFLGDLTLLGRRPGDQVNLVVGFNQTLRSFRAVATWGAGPTAIWFVHPLPAIDRGPSGTGPWYSQSPGHWEQITTVPKGGQVKTVLHIDSPALRAGELTTIRERIGRQIISRPVPHGELIPWRDPFQRKWALKTISYQMEFDLYFLLQDGNQPPQVLSNAGWFVDMNVLFAKAPTGPRKSRVVNILGDDARLRQSARSPQPLLVGPGVVETAVKGRTKKDAEALVRK
jgi:hypothetical protein